MIDRSIARQSICYAERKPIYDRSKIEEEHHLPWYSWSELFVYF